MAFYPLKIAEIRPESADCVSVALQVPSHWEELFRFRAGQYLNFLTYIGGEEIRRSYSICSSPLEGEWRVAIKKVPGGVFSTFANTDLKAGDSIEVMPPMGRFGHEIHDQDGQTFVAFAAGSGITPILSILKTVLASQPNSRFILFFGNQSRHSILFKKELEALKNQHMGQLSIYHILSREMQGAAAFEGRIDTDKCRFYLNKLIPCSKVDQYFICGPEEMIHTVKACLLEAGIPAAKIHFELFGVKNKNPQIKVANGLKGPVSKVKIHLDGHSFEIPVDHEAESILDVALRTGADLPFACKGGVCSTCRAKVLEGKVKMEVNYALEADEVAAGYVLTCQSHPLSEQVILDFDAK